jgi:hypothetical protein
MYDSLQGFLRVVTALPENPPTMDYQPWLGPVQDIPHLCSQFFPVVTPLCADFAASVHLGVPSVSSLPFL